MTNPTRIGTLALAALLAPPLPAAPSTAGEAEPPKLLGRIDKGQLGVEPYAEWFGPGYDGYEPNPEVLAELRHLGHRGSRHPAADQDCRTADGARHGDLDRRAPESYSRGTARQVGCDPTGGATWQA